MPRLSLSRLALLGLVALSLGPTTIVASESGPIDAKLQKAEGGKLRIQDLRGRPLLIDFWATWCLPCREQETILADLQQELGGRGVSVLAVSLAERPQTVRGFLDGNPHRFPVALDPYRVLGDRLGIETVPSLALLDAEGRLVAVHHGPGSREQILGLVERLDG